MLTGNYYLVIPVLLPILAAILFPVFNFKTENMKKIYTIGIAIVEFLIMICLSLDYQGTSSLLFSIDNKLTVGLSFDYVAVIYTLLVSFIWVNVVTYSHGYLEKGPRETSYYVFLLALLGVLVGLGMASNMVSFYIFYELMTFLCFPLISYSGEKQDVDAAVTFLIYSIFGATMALAGIAILANLFGIPDFASGGLYVGVNYALKSTPFIVAFLLIFFGFGTKAGIYPLQAWLPIAHPAAPAAISGPLSGLITKAGVLGILRYVYYCIGLSSLSGTWLQKLWMGVTLLTIFIGSMLAFREPVLKKRLAYSSISQVSYVLFGLSIMDENALQGSLMQLCYHGLAKTILFLCAGIIIHETGKTRVEELKAVGKEMNTVMWCFTLASLSLIGIPPMGGFLSKWYLIMGALEADVGVFSYVGPAVLLLSSLLTAGYLLPIIIRGFFPGSDYDYSTRVKRKSSPFMVLPVLLLTGALLVISVFPNLLTGYISNILFSIFAGV